MQDARRVGLWWAEVACYYRVEAGGGQEGGEEVVDGCAAAGGLMDVLFSLVLRNAWVGMGIGIAVGLDRIGIGMGGSRTQNSAYKFPS